MLRPVVDSLTFGPLDDLRRHRRRFTTSAMIPPKPSRRPRRPSCLFECAELKLEIFISLGETDARFLREAKQPESKEDRSKHEKQWSAIGVFEPEERGHK